MLLAVARSTIHLHQQLRLHSIYNMELLSVRLVLVRGSAGTNSIDFVKEDDGGSMKFGHFKQDLN